MRTQSRDVMMGTVLVVQRVFSWWVAMPLVVVLTYLVGGYRDGRELLGTFIIFSLVALLLVLVIQLVCHAAARCLGAKGGAYCPTCGATAAPHTSPRTTPPHAPAGHAGGQSHYR